MANSRLELVSPVASAVMVSYRVATSPGGPTHRVIAERLADELSTGTWTRGKRLGSSAHQAFISRLDPIDQSSFAVEIAVPVINLSPGDIGIAGLLTLFAGDVFALKEVNAIRVENLLLPASYLSNFSGPVSGSGGIYQRLKLVTNRPILSVILRLGLVSNVDECADLAYKLFSSGADMIVDDRLFHSPQSAQIDARIPAMLKAAARASKETGETKNYLVNATADPPRLQKTADLVQSVGGVGVYIDVGTVGYPQLKELSRARGGTMIVGGYHSGYGVIARDPMHGVDLSVLVKLIRLSGADATFVPPPLGRMFATSQPSVTEREKIEECVRVLTENWFNIKPTLPAYSGGIHAGNVEANLSITGPRTVYHIGGGIFENPAGPEKAVSSLKALLTGLAEGRTTEEMARKDVVLRDTISRWKYLPPPQVE